MSNAPIEVVEPLVRAWRRTRSLLFAPFALERWLVLGLSAWLAVWTGAGGGGNFGWLVSPPTGDPGSLDLSREGLSSWFFGLTIVVIAVIVTLAVIWTVFRLWLQSRFEFVFLDNLAGRHTRIAQPWSDYAPQGTSLFWGRLILGVGLVTILLMPVALAVASGVRPGVVAFGWMLFLVVLLVPLILAGALLVFAVNQFVVPIMAHQKLLFFPALARFRDLLAAHPGPFALYTLLYLVLSVALGMVLVTVGVLTCCLGLILFSLPYVGAVVLLPVGVCARYYGLEFLRQFGAEFDLLGPLEAPSEVAPPPQP